MLANRHGPARTRDFSKPAGESRELANLMKHDDSLQYSLVDEITQHLNLPETSVA
jgi:hypothetical protein